MLRTTAMEAARKVRGITVEEADIKEEETDDEETYEEKEEEIEAKGEEGRWKSYEANVDEEEVEETKNGKMTDGKEEEDDTDSLDQFKDELAQLGEDENPEG